MTAPAASAISSAAAERLRAAEEALRARAYDAAIAAARAAAALAPGHADVQRCLARALSARGPSAEALGLMQRAAAARPDDPVFAATLGMVLDANAQGEGAIAAFRRACTLRPGDAAHAYNLGRALSRHGHVDEAQAVLERALELDPRHWSAAAALVEVLRQRGLAAQAIAQCRRLLERNPADARIWSALAGMREQRFDAADIGALERAAASHADPESRIRIGFALGKAYADVERHGDSLRAYQEACGLMRAARPWDAAAHSREVDAIIDAFGATARAADPQRGAGVLFIVSLPRAGSTLVEQILASHPAVAAGGELPDLFQVIAEECARRRAPLARWAALATDEDWQRLGSRYLERTAHLRSGRQFLTDKLPANWLWLGAALSMLPGARVVECRRDTLEVAWSCFTQLFPAGTQDFSYDFASIGAFFGDYERAMQCWRARHGAAIRVQRHEALAAEFEAQVRALLAHCGLAFDPACLRFHENTRRVRTISSTQVREPLRRDTARTAAYGALLDPLRVALGLPPSAAVGA